MFESGDLEHLDLQDIDNWSLGGISNISDWLGRAFTILDETDKVVGVSGFSCEDGVGTGWLVGSKRLRDRPVYLHRSMKRVLRELLRNPNVNRIQAVVEQKSVAASRWLERLGFRRDSENAGVVLYILEDA